MSNLKNKYPLIIIGAGSAGLTASIYAARYQIDSLVVGEVLGGLAFEAHKICNFPTEQEISGMQLIQKMQQHTESLGVSIVTDKVIDVDQEDNIFKVTTQNNQIFYADTLLLAIGTEHRKMNLPNEKRFIGKGISYCPTCDAMFYKDKTVAVVGGSDSANTASLYLAKIASKVYQIYRRDKLRGESIWIDQVLNNKKIEVIYNTKIVDVKGNEKLEKIVLNNFYQRKNEINIDGLFVEIGTVPQRMLIQELSLETNADGYIQVTPDQKTNRIGVWAAGDITTLSNNFHQVITACGEGAVAAEDIFKFLQKMNNE